MKNFFFGFILALVVSLAIAYVYWRDESNKSGIIVRDPIVSENSDKVDSLSMIIAGKDTIQAQSDKKLIDNHNRISSLLSKNETLKSRLDSAICRYNRLKSIETCDSLVNAQDSVIACQGGIIAEYEIRDSEYEFNSGILRDKLSLLDSINKIQSKTIDKLNINIDKLNCYESKSKQHKFIFWIFHLKCN